MLPTNLGLGSVSDPVTMNEVESNTEGRLMSYSGFPLVGTPQNTCVYPSYIYMYMHIVLVRVSIPALCKHHGRDTSWGGKGLCSLHFHIAIHHQRKSGQELTQGRNLEAGADAEVMEGAAYWIASPGLLSLLSYKTQDGTSPGCHSQWTGPSLFDH